MTNIARCPMCGSTKLELEHRILIDTDAKKTKQLVLVKCPGPHSYFLCETVNDFAKFFSKPMPKLVELAERIIIHGNCPFCGRGMPGHHAPDCEWDAAIGELDNHD